MDRRSMGLQGTPHRPKSFRTPMPSPLAGEDGAHLAHAAWPLPWRWPLVLTTAIVSATVLLLEVTLTRVFSLYLSYHYVFVVLAMALLGLGLGAICLAALRPWVLR